MYHNSCTLWNIRTKIFLKVGAMAIYLYLGCSTHKECVPLSRSGSSGNGPLAGNENLYKFLDVHEFCPLVEVVRDTSSIFEAYSRFDVKKAPAGEDRGQGGSKETTTKNESSV